MFRILALVLICAAALPAAGGLSPIDEAGYKKVLAAAKGRVVLVDFWATYCPPCRAEMPALVALETKLKSKGFQLITVSADEPAQFAAAAKFLAAARVAGPAYVRVVQDEERFIGSVDPKWNGAMPALFLYDRAGRKVKSYLGETAAARIEADIARLP
jgi:thiol-disulfide isomerase/thioredoxin